MACNYYGWLHFLFAGKYLFKNWLRPASPCATHCYVNVHGQRISTESKSAVDLIMTVFGFQVPALGVNSIQKRPTRFWSGSDVKYIPVTDANSLLSLSVSNTKWSDPRWNPFTKVLDDNLFACVGLLATIDVRKVASKVKSSNKTSGKRCGDSQNK